MFSSSDMKKAIAIDSWLSLAKVRWRQPAVTSESLLETACCLQRTFAGDSQLKYMDGILRKNK